MQAGYSACGIGFPTPPQSNPQMQPPSLGSKDRCHDESGHVLTQTRRSGIPGDVHRSSQDFIPWGMVLRLRPR